MTLLKKMLTLDMAKKCAKAIENKAKENNINIVISIFDNHGNLKYFQRMDSTSYGSIRISQLKAKTAASMPLTSRALQERSANMPANPYGAIPDMLLLGGGLPIITKDNQHIGSIGISGATPELDEMCAQAGLDEIAEEMN
jgi:glc operon protein GlcG